MLGKAIFPKERTRYFEEFSLVEVTYLVEYLNNLTDMWTDRDVCGLDLSYRL